MSLIDLVRVGGLRVVEHAPIGPLTTYRVGGSARAMVTCSTMQDVIELMPLVAATGLDVIVVGNGSNLLFADGEQPIVVVRLDGDFESLRWSDRDGSVRVVAGGAIDLPVMARRLAAEGIAGFEWAVGVPGTVGGAVAMNAGGHGSDMDACVSSVDLWHEGARSTWEHSRLGFDYRTSAVGADDVVLYATFSLVRGDVGAAQARLREIVRWRRAHQPGGANAGSVFRNPEGGHAGQLIEAAGCKGMRLASAVVSDKHANFIIADAGGAARDVYELIDLVRARVQSQSGVLLRVENRFVGFEEPR